MPLYLVDLCVQLKKEKATEPEARGRAAEATAQRQLAAQLESKPISRLVDVLVLGEGGTGFCKVSSICSGRFRVLGGDEACRFDVPPACGTGPLSFPCQLPHHLVHFCISLF